MRTSASKTHAFAARERDSERRGAGVGGGAVCPVRAMLMHLLPDPVGRSRSALPARVYLLPYNRLTPRIKAKNARTTENTERFLSLAKVYSLSRHETLSTRFYLRITRAYKPRTGRTVRCIPLGRAVLGVEHGDAREGVAAEQRVGGAQDAPGQGREGGRVVEEVLIRVRVRVTKRPSK